MNKIQYYTYENQLVFDSKLDGKLQNISTTNISNALENSPIVNDENKLIGTIHNVTHRNATLYYGDLILIDKLYSQECSIKHQTLTFDKNDKLSHIISYINDVNEK